jgi:hypothetical protein
LVSDIKNLIEAEVFDKGLLRRIFLSKRDEMKAGWRKLEKEGNL